MTTRSSQPDGGRGSQRLEFGEVLLFSILSVLIDPVNVIVLSRFGGSCRVFKRSYSISGIDVSVHLPGLRLDPRPVPSHYSWWWYAECITKALRRSIRIQDTNQFDNRGKYICQLLLL